MRKRNKTIRNLLVVLGVLVVILIGKDYLPKGKEGGDLYIDKWAGVRVEAVEGISVGDEGEVLQLTKTDNNWRVNEYPADADLISEMLNALVKPEKIDLVSENAQRHQALGVASESAKIKIKLADREKVLIVGTVSSGGRYVRLDGSDEVYLIGGLTANMTAVKPESWVEKTLTAVDEKQMKRVLVRVKGTELALEQKDGEWYEAGTVKALDRSSISGLINTLTAFETLGLDVGSDSKQYPTAAELVIVVEQEGKDPIELKLYRGEDEALVESSERAGKYRISTTLLDSLEIEKADLVLKPEPTGTNAPNN